MEHHSGTRYFRSLRFDGDSCEVLLSSPSGDRELLTFKYVRSLLFIKESDFFGKIALYEKLPLKTDTGDASSAFQIIKNTIIGGALSNRLEDEQPLYFGVWTPDECFELACFETPTISFRAAG